MEKTVAVDVDGVIFEYDGWNGLYEFGDLIPGAREFLTTLGRNFEVLINTTRVNSRINQIDYLTEEQSIGYQVRLLEEQFEKYDLSYDRIWTERGKPLAVFIVDDRALPIRPDEADKPRQVYSDVLKEIDKKEGLS